MKNLQKLFTECKAELDKLGIEYGEVTSISPNYRAKSRWGQCCLHRSFLGDTYQININVDLLRDDIPDKGAKETILHELLHTCEGGMSHTGVWKDYAFKVNKAYGYNIKRTDTYKDKGLPEPITSITPKYVLKCTKCGAEIPKTRMSEVVRHPENYRCGKCHGKIVRVK